MTAELRDLLDDLSAEVVQDVPIDLDDVYVRVAGHRRDRWRTVGRNLLVAAAVLLLAAPLVTSLLPVTAVPATGEGRTGLPDSWFDVPRGLPNVRHEPMTAASMVLGAGPTVTRDYPVNGYFLVSADGRRYAQLPWKGGANEDLALSPDGRQVAWLDMDDSDHPRLRTWRLAEGRRTSVELPAGAGHQVVWGDGGIYVVQDQAVSFVTAAGQVRRLCTCHVTALARSGDGRVFQPAAEGGYLDIEGMPWVPMTSWDRAAYGSVSTPLTASPDGTRSAFADSVQPAEGEQISGGSGYGYEILIGRRNARGKAVTQAMPVPGGTDVAYATAMAWSDRGVLVRVTTLAGDENGPTTLYELNPDTGVWRELGTGPRQVVPVAVANDVVAAGLVPAVRPVVTRWERFVNALLSPPTPPLPVYVLLVVIAGAGVLVRRRMRTVAQAEELT
ncbi:hypothetical protein ACIB24_04425 [Spongisporangium articulatum]|uniref:WD40-like Beta Propeller Repeat n=1 Tax=Spongisporangium articulatum TaxID=3362603 RepID=A0ABW8AIW3_9ACTN